MYDVFTPCKAPRETFVTSPIWKPETGLIKCAADHCRRVAKTSDPYCSHHAWHAKRNGGILPEPTMSERVQWLYDHSQWIGQDCLIFPFTRNPATGYCQVFYDGESVTAHRLMCSFAHGWPDPCIERIEAAHSCGMGHEACVNPQHLEWKTPLENRQDRDRHAREKVGRYA